MADLTIEDVTQIDPANITEEQTTFLNENIADLSDENVEKYSLTRPTDSDADADNVSLELDNFTPPVAPAAPAVSTGDPAEWDDPDELVDPVAKKAIQGYMDKREANTLANAEKVNAEAAVGQAQAQADRFVVQNPEFAKFRPFVDKYLNHEESGAFWRKVPVRMIFNDIAASDMMAIGAAKEREAQKKAKNTQSKETPGKTETPERKKVDHLATTPEEHAAIKAKAMGQPAPVKA